MIYRGAGPYEAKTEEPFVRRDFKSLIASINTNQMHRQKEEDERNRKGDHLHSNS